MMLVLYAIGLVLCAVMAFLVMYALVVALVAVMCKYILGPLLDWAGM